MRSMGIHSVGTSDAALVRRVRTGDTGAYADLVARYRDRLGRYALHMLGNREDAEEVLQDAFVRAYRSLARCDDPERFGAWLYGILVNRCRTAGARAARRARRFVNDPAALETEDMARLTGAGISALKMRVKRAREQLQAMLKETERV